MLHRTVAVAALLLLLLACELPAPSAATASRGCTEFAAWASEHGRFYEGSAAFNERCEVYLKNERIVAQLNRDAHLFGHNVTFSLNEWADLTPLEFEQTILMPKRTPPKPDPAHIAPRKAFFAPIPDSVDWRQEGAVTPVRNQGSTGTCWAFSTIETIESQWFINSRSLVELSVEMLADCDNSTDPSNLHADCGVFGGWPYLAYGFLQRLGGIMPESAMPYCSGTGACYPCVPSGWNKTRCGDPPTYCRKNDSCDARLSRSDFVEGLQVSSYVAITEGETQMAEEVYSRGPLSILIDATGLQFYHSGIWHPKFCSKTQTDHAVVIVGYGTDSSTPYWIVRNSWGEKWGDKGYFNMYRGDNTCGITTGATCAVLA